MGSTWGASASSTRRTWGASEPEYVGRSRVYALVKSRGDATPRKREAKRKWPGLHRPISARRLAPVNKPDADWPRAFQVTTTRPGVALCPGRLCDSVAWRRRAASFTQLGRRWWTRLFCGLRGGDWLGRARRGGCCASWLGVVTQPLSVFTVHKT